MKEQHECTECKCNAKFVVADEWWCAIYVPGHVDSRTAARLAREQYAAELQALKDESLELVLSDEPYNTRIITSIRIKHAALQQQKGKATCAD